MNLNKKATQKAMKDFTDAMIEGQKEISNEQIINEFVDDTIQKIRRLNTRKYDINGYIKKKQREADRYESNYYKYKERILSSDMNQELAFEKLETAFDHLQELREDLEMLKQYRK